MRNVALCLLLLAAPPAPVSADPRAEAAAALALASASQPARPAGLTYAEAFAKARTERRDIIIWIGGFACLPCAAETPDAVHVHVASLEGDASPRVLVGAYNPADGKLWCLDYLYSAGSGVISRQRERVRATFVRAAQPVQYHQPTYYQPAPSFGSMPFRGGGAACRTG